MREHSARDDTRGRHAIRPSTDVAALAHHAVRDIDVGTDEVVRGDVLEGDGPVGQKTGADAHLGCRPTDRLERLLEREDEPDRPAGAEGHEGHERLVLGVLLAAEAAARIGRVDANPGQWHAQQPGDGLLQPVGMLDRAPHGDAVAVGCGHEGMRLDGEVRDDGERVGVIDDQVGRRGLDVAPADAVLPDDVAAGQGVIRAEGRILHQWCRRIERLGDGHHSRQLLVLHPHQAGGLLGGILRLGSHGGDRVAVVLGLSYRDDGPVLELRPEARHRLRQVRRPSSPGAHPGPRSAACVSMATILARAAGTRDQLGVQLAGQMDVGDVSLAAADPCLAADAVRESRPPGCCSLTRLPRDGLRGGRPGSASIDLLVAAAAAEVAGQALLDLFDRRVRRRAATGRRPP